MIPPGLPSSIPVAHETVDASPSQTASVGLVARVATDAAIKVSFFDEQKRRRQQTLGLSLMCLLIALALGLAMSTILGPLAFGITAGAMKLAAVFGCTDVCSKTARGIGLFARDEVKLLVVVVDRGSNVRTFAQRLLLVRDLLTFSVVLLPSMITGAVAWIVIRLSLRRAGALDLVVTTHARTPRSDDRKEQQLVNGADEMALAAGLPTPRIVIIDTEVANAAVAGTSHVAATVLVTRGLVELLNRDQMQAIMAHCIASIGNGDLRLIHSLLATFQTLGLFHTILDLPFRWSAWRALGRFARATLDPRISPTRIEQAVHGIEETFSAESVAPLSIFIVPLLPLRLVTLFQRFVLQMWCILVLNWPLALLWRARRYLADSTAVQLTRNPDALASALSRLAAHTGIPPGGENREYLFMWGTGRSGFDRYGMTLPMHPSLDRRLKRLAAMGASMAREQPDASLRRRRIVGLRIFLVVVSPLLLVGVLAVMGLVGAILWISLFTVLISLILGLGFLSWAFGP